MPSIAEIARRAGVSRCTASLVLNRSRGYQRFSPSVRERVATIAAELGWARDSRGLALQQGRTGVLALALHDHGRETGLSRALIGALERAARHHDQYLMIIGGGIAQTVDAVRSRRCDGAMVVGWNLGPVEQRLLASCNHQVLWNVPADMNGVDMDVAAGLTRAVSHLHGLGHRRLLWLHADINGGHEQRWAVISRAADRLGMGCRRMALPYAAAADLGADEEHEVAVLRGLLAERMDAVARSSAVICYNELVAISLYAAAAGRLRIPEDLSVIGIDDVHAGLAVPPLTCVAFDLERMAEEAMVRLLQPSPKRRLAKISSGLTVRASCAPPAD